MVVRTGGQSFILEFKMVASTDGAATALKTTFTQMRARGYANRGLDRQEPVHLAAGVCGGTARNLLEVRAERVNSS